MNQPPDQPQPGRILEFSRLHEHRDRLFRAALALCRSRDDAEDLVQETYERVLRRPRLIRRDDDLGYLLKVLRNTWINNYHASMRRPQTLEFDEAIGVDSSASSGDPLAGLQLWEVHRAVAGLALPLREAIVAVDIVGLSYRQAAHALGVPIGTIMSRLHRARARVAAELSDCTPGALGEAPAGRPDEAELAQIPAEPDPEQRDLVSQSRRAGSATAAAPQQTAA